MKSSFVQGSFLLVLVNLILMFLDFSYNVFLSKLIGAEGMGLLQMAMSILMVFLALSSGGIPTAISKLIAEQNSKNRYVAKRILKFTILFVLVLAVILSFILMFFAPSLAIRVFKDETMFIFIYFLAPAVLIISISSVLRGYFYGLKMIIVPSISQIIEHVGRFIVVLGFLYYKTPTTPTHGALVAIAGISIGEVLDLIWLSFMGISTMDNKIHGISPKIKGVNILKQILQISIPIGASNILMVILRFANSVLIPSRLVDAGYSNNVAIATFGRITGMAMPIITLPFIVTSAMVINLVPSLSEQMALKNYKEVKNHILFAIKITLLFSIPLTGLYAFFHEPIGLFLYGDLQVSRFIYIMGFNTTFLALQHTFSGILHGLNKQITAAINRIIGMVLQISMVWILVGIPKFGINGYFIAFFLSGLSICFLDFLMLKRMMKLNIDYWDILLKPLIGSLSMICIIYISSGLLSHLYISEVLNFVLSLTIGVLFYITVLYLTKAIPNNILNQYHG